MTRPCSIAARAALALALALAVLAPLPGRAAAQGEGRWTPLPTAGAPGPRQGATAVWTGTELLIWGGTGQASNGIRGDILGDGAAYNPTTNTWRALPTAGAPSLRLGDSAVWTGTEMLIWGGYANPEVANYFGDGAAYTPPATTIPHDSRYFPQTGYRIDNDAIWDYFNRRGGVPTFGYPTSRTFTLQGFTVQFFQRKIVQLDNNGRARLLNLLDPGLLPYTSFNFSTFPAPDAALVAQAPAVGSPGYADAALAFVRQHAPDTWNGLPVRFGATFTATTPEQAASSAGGDPGVLAAMDLELWGLPTSAPAYDPHNHRVVYLRWQRGVMQYDADCNCTRAVLLADALKAALTLQFLPPDLAGEARYAPFFAQYCPGAPG